MSEQKQQQQQRSQVTSLFTEQNMRLVFFAIIAALLVAYWLSELQERHGTTSRRNTVSPKPDESEPTS